MKQELKYVNFYKLSLLKGCCEGMKATGGHSFALLGGTGSYITPMLDTAEAGCTYYRLTVDGRFEGAKLEIIVAATDETEAIIDDIPQNLESWLKNPQVPASRKAEILRALPHVRAVNTQDILLYSLSGRYVWMYVALYPAGKCDCELVGLRLELPRYSFTGYFPEIYQEDDFFERYIAVFQSMFLEVEQLVDHIPRLLDYRTTPDDNVEYLAGWVGIDNSRRLFTPEQLRHLIKNIDIYQGAKGTKYALERIIFLLTGIRPRIVEHFQWMKPHISANQLMINRRLYGETANCFCIILDLTKARMNVNENDFEQLIESYGVLGSQFKVVYLKTCSHTDTHCYLDINSALSVPETAYLDNGALGGNITIG